ncbi:MAG TPA: hypothetical protein VK585_09635 [Jiangellaceae bacterium]|nr:hypothetical protein [Jiangellaceae bacterium]
MGRVMVAVFGAAGEHRPTGQFGDRGDLGRLGARLHPLGGADLVDQIPFDRDRLIRRPVGPRAVGGGGWGLVGEQCGQLPDLQRHLDPARPGGQRGERHPHHRPAGGRDLIEPVFEHEFDSSRAHRH